VKSTPFTLEGRTFWEADFPMYMTRERERFTLPMHIHDFVEIQYVAEGKGYHYIGEERILVEKGDLFIIPIGTRHVYRPASEARKDELIVYNCLFAPSVPDVLLRSYPLPPEVGQLLSGMTRTYLRYKDTFHEGRMHIEAMYREYKTKQPGREAALYALLTQLLVYLYRLEINLVSTLPAYTQLSSILAYIEDNYNRALVLSDIAKLVPTSPSYMQRIFKRATGQSFTEYIQNLRMKKCTELLAQSSLSIKEIAEQVGYRDMKFFHTLFRKKTGQSPLQYRIRTRQLTIAPGQKEV
jgi:AraC family L-rhamnose operon transcriptional activator RhaR